MLSSKCCWHSLLLTLCVVSSWGSVCAQTTAGLRRDDVVIRKDRPSIYLCVDKELWQRRKADEDIWLRAYNNTVWAIRFDAEKMGTATRPLKLSNGNTVAALSNSSVSFPHFQVEQKGGGGKSTGSLWGDVATSNWLPSDTGARFKVPARYFKDGNLYLVYQYEWELIGIHARESHAPVHKIYLYGGDSDSAPGPFCDVEAPAAR